MSFLPLPDPVFICMESRPCLPLEQLRPMLAQDLRDFPDDEQQTIWNNPRWIAEEKLNGVRLLGFIGHSENRFTTRVISKRSGLFQERTDNFPHLRDLSLGFLDGTILDGELLLNKPRLFTGSAEAVGTLACTMAVTNCGPERAAETQRREGMADFHVFDVLRDRGRWVGDEPLYKRRARLEAIFRELDGQGIGQRHLKLLSQERESKHAYYQSILANGGEGVVLKHAAGLYKMNGRSALVLKAKRFLTVDGFISGFTPGEHGNSGKVGSLLVSAYDSDGNVREIAGVGPYDLSRGANSNLREAVTVQAPSGPQLSPQFLGRVVELEAFCWNRNLRLVHAKILRFRDGDKARTDCIIDFGSMRVG